MKDFAFKLFLNCFVKTLQLTRFRIKKFSILILLLRFPRIICQPIFKN